VPASWLCKTLNRECPAFAGLPVVVVQSQDHGTDADQLFTSFPDPRRPIPSKTNTPPLRGGACVSPQDVARLSS
jgi:hypothetical protein